jgi:ankyrin repeat protein
VSTTDTYPALNTNHDKNMKTLIATTLIQSLTFVHLPAGELRPTGTNLLQAIRAGDAGKAEALMQDAAALEARDEHGNTPLMTAAWLADATMLERLLKAGADVNAGNKAGATALLYASTLEDKARLLIASGADVKAQSKLGNTALILAARKPGNSRTVKLLLGRGANVHAKNVFGTTALMCAAAAGDMDSVRLLLDAGADINARPNMDVDGFIFGGGRTPLMWAAFLGAEPLAKLLLERGAKIDAFTQVGSALGQAAWGGHDGMARLLLDAGAPVDQRDLIANYTPLHWAASSELSSPALVELLLSHHADVNAEGGQPVDNFLGVTQTPLMLARKRGDTPVVQALLKAGAKAPTPDRKARDKAQGEAKSMAEAIQRALPSLTRTAEDSAATFVRHSSRQKCISCHQQQLPLAALSVAHSRQFTTDREIVRHQLELLKRDLADPEIAMQGVMLPDPAIFAGYVAMDLLGAGESASPLTDAMVHMLVTIQHPDGHWSRYIPRPPIQASDITATASALHMIKSFGIASRRPEMDSSVQRARAWLINAHAETNEERVHQLLGLGWSGGDADTLQALAKQLVQRQRADGGWAQLAGLESDAYGTGQSLQALLEGAKLTPADPAVRRGLDFLRRTQLADGTWHVRSRTHTFQPPMESSFAHGRDGWISAAGSSWAVMALATSLDPAQPPPLPAPAIAKAASTAPDVARSELKVDFANDIQPALERSCVRCHSGEHPKGGFMITSRAELLHGGKRGEAAVIPGRADDSPLLRLVHDEVEDLEMPPLAKRGKYPALTLDEVAKIRAWIDQGACWPDGVLLGTPAN